MRTFATVSVTGLVGLVLLKLLWALVVPALGLVLGMVALTVKLALWAAVIYFLVTVFRRRKDERPT